MGTNISQVRIATNEIKSTHENFMQASLALWLEVQWQIAEDGPGVGSWELGDGSGVWVGGLWLLQDGCRGSCRGCGRCTVLLQEELLHEGPRGATGRCVRR